MRLRPYPLQTSPDLMNALVLIALLMALTALLVRLLYGNTFRIHYTVDDSGARSEPDAAQAKVSTFARRALLLAGLCSGRPGPQGTALLVDASAAHHVNWKDVHEVVARPADRVVVLRDRRRTRLLLFCTNENYEAVLHMAQQNRGC